MIVLDTNVVSEFTRKEPSDKVLQWLAKQDVASLYLTSITIMELYWGAWNLPLGKKRTSLEYKIGQQASVLFGGRVLAFDDQAARICADLMVKGKSHTPFAKLPDYQIAATAIRHGFAVATRDVKDFDHEGLAVINPWGE